jgi:ribA/ribD-fused uncharacterized protein
MPINHFRGQHFYLSNFYQCACGVEFDGDVYPTSEHAYQAAKVERREGRQAFTCGGSLGDNPMDAKRKGGKVTMRPGWNAMKVLVMAEIVRSKFHRDPTIAAKLVQTRDQKIVEGHTIDKFWGGRRNHLGNILIRMRQELTLRPSPRADEPAPQSKAKSVKLKTNKGKYSDNWHTQPWAYVEPEPEPVPSIGLSPSTVKLDEVEGEPKAEQNWKQHVHKASGSNTRQTKKQNQKERRRQRRCEGYR